MLDQVYLAFDYGQKKIGVAIANSFTKQAQPLIIIQQSTKEYRFSKVQSLINEWQPSKIIVGLPLTMDEQEQPASQQARRFAQQLEERFKLPVELVDERGSSLEAQTLVGNDPDDAVAAAIILQRFLDKEFS